MASVPDRPADRDTECQLYDVLIALGYRARERVSICTQEPGRKHTFKPELWHVGYLAGWAPPQDKDVWWGANPIARHVRSGKGGEADITRMHTLFADLDVKPGRCLDTLDQCYAAAWELAEYVDAKPVAMVESGHGLQPLWRVGSPPGDSNVVGRARSRDEFRKLWWRFGAVAQRAAQNATWRPDQSHTTRTIDGVYNIDRLLRCPGSVNWKYPDAPAPVRTRRYGGGRVLLRELVARLDRDGIQPLKLTKAIVTGVPTDFGEAEAWIHEQPCATADMAELNQMPRSQALHEYLDPVALVRVLGDGDGAHRTMVAKVLHAVYSAQEGRAGLVVALTNIGEAYLSIMAARERGELVGDARDATTATVEWQNAVRSAVAKARGRHVPNLDAWARRAFGGETEGKVTARRYWPHYQPQYQPAYRARRWGR
jgi:hypothetical protein